MFNVPLPNSPTWMKPLETLPPVTFSVPVPNRPTLTKERAETLAVPVTFSVPVPESPT